LRRSDHVLTVDISSAPYVLHFWSGRPTTEDLIQLRGCLQWEARYDGSIYCFIDLRGGTVPEAAMLRQIGALFREFEQMRKTALLVVIVDNWVVVSMLNALRWITGQKTPEIFVRTAEDAIREAEPRLRALGAPLIPAEVRAKLLGPKPPTSTTWVSA
jgi:hypothetical protein